MGNDVCAQIPAPGGKRAIQNPEAADHDHIRPTLIAVEQAEHHALRQDSHYDVPAQRMELTLQKSAKCQFLADPSSD